MGDEQPDGLRRVGAYNRLAIGRRFAKATTDSPNSSIVRKRKTVAEAEKSACLAPGQSGRVEITKQGRVQESTEWSVKGAMKFSVQSSVRPGSNPSDVLYSAESS